MIAKILPLKKEKVEIPSIKRQLCDPKASPCALNLASYLVGLVENGKILYGHQNDLHCKAGPADPSFTSSDTRDACGECAGVMGLDALSLTGTELGAPDWPRKKRLEAALDLSCKAAKQGSIITLSAHMPNFALLAGTGDYSGYSPNELRGHIVQDIMPDRPLNSLFTDYLDLVSDYLAALGKRGIPVIWRPFHENTGGWFWWGCNSCSAKEFKNLWRYTWKYMTEKKQLHNLIWAYSPGSEPSSIEEFEERYPGDAYVDVIGLDMYQNYSLNPHSFWQDYERQLDLSNRVSLLHKKLFAATETGIMRPDNKALLESGNERGWYKKVLDLCVQYNAAYFLLWANFSRQGAFYTPYVLKRTCDENGWPLSLEGHELLDDFIAFHNEESVVFSSQNPSFITEE